jgi:endonuclease-3
MAKRRTKRSKKREQMSAGDALKVLDILEETHPDARVYLDYKTPLQLVVATILSAQCTDAKVNEITPALFRKYRTAEDFANADLSKLEQQVRSTGFFRKKAQRVRDCCALLVEEHGGKVPADLEVLAKMEGIGRKTASVIAAEAFGIPAIAVDTHVERVSTRLGMATGRTPGRIEKDLRGLIPENRWIRATQLLGTHGRRICSAKKPDHEACPVRQYCAFYAELQSESK